MYGRCFEGSSSKEKKVFFIPGRGQQVLSFSSTLLHLVWCYTSDLYCSESGGGGSWGGRHHLLYPQGADVQVHILLHLLMGWVETLIRYIVVSADVI